MQELKNKTIKELRQLAQSTAPEAGRDPYVGLTIRFFSIYITYFLIRTKITPNPITFISVIIFLLGSSMFIFGDLTYYFIGLFLVYLSIVLDGCDGEVARLKGSKRFVGTLYVEPISHDIQYALFFIPITIGAYLVSGSIFVVYAGFVAAISKLLYRFLITRYQIMSSERNHTTGNREIIYNKEVGFFHGLYRYLNRNFFSSVGTIIPLFIFSVFNRIDLFVYLFAFFYLFVFIIVFLKHVKYIFNLKD